MNEGESLNPINKKLKHPFLKISNTKSQQNFLLFSKSTLDVNHKIHNSNDKANKSLQISPKQQIILPYQQRIKQLQSQKQAKEKEYQQLFKKHVQLQDKYISLLQGTKNNSYFLDGDILSVSNYSNQMNTSTKKEKLMEIRKKLQKMQFVKGNSKFRDHDLDDPSNFRQ